MFGVASLALYASAPNHVFGQMLGFPGSWVCRLMFRSYRLWRPKEDYSDCALVIPDEHLSRESRKLTVMIQRETGQPLEDSSESIGFFRINEGPFPDHVHTPTRKTTVIVPRFGRASTSVEKAEK